MPHKKNLLHFYWKCGSNLCQTRLTDNVLGMQKFLTIWSLGTHNCILRDNAFTQSNFACTHSILRWFRGQGSHIWPCLPGFHTQRICPYPPGKMCLDYSRASWRTFSCQSQLRVTTVWLSLLWGLRLMFHEVFIGKNENNLFQLLCRSQIYIIIGCNTIHDGLPQSVRDTIPASVSALEEEPGLLYIESTEL